MHGWYRRNSQRKTQRWIGQIGILLWDFLWFFSGVSTVFYTSRVNYRNEDILITLLDFSQQSLQNWLYYFVSTKTDNISELSRFTGILRGQESFSQAVSFGINTRDWYGGRVPLAVNTILLGRPNS